ncbi:MAG TPA: cytochrome c oxidase subunit I [Streptosporangiaceae bacterium]|nr:cytochrome c oxidase subunit I [Streptosporangiaceae bacterium]
MTAAGQAEHPVTDFPALSRPRKGSVLAAWLSSTDHKVIGYLYLITSFCFFLFGGIMAMIMRAQLMGPNNRIVSDQQFNELFTMHGTIMLLLFATPLFVGFTNVVMPLQIGAPDVAFPRLNLLSYYLFTFGGLILLFSFLTPGGSASFGWYAYAPLTSSVYSPGIGADMWIMGLTLSGLSTILGGVNFITTIFCMRAPGMTMFRMPIFTWNALLTSMLALLAFPVLAAALLVLEIDRKLGAHVFDASSGGALLWQNLFWFFGHPEVYIVALPFFGIVTEVIPVFSRKPLFGYKSLIGATIAIAGLSMTVWAHHMFTTGAVLLPFFSFMTFLIAIPTGVKFFNWVGTMWRGQLSFEPAMLFAIGFLVTFLFGGLTGIILASPPMDFHVSDTYFVVAHFHYVLFGTVVFAMFAGFYFWWPKMTGKMLDNRLGKLHFWTLFFGFHGTFLVQHWLGVIGMPRRIANYPDLPGIATTLNDISSISAFVLGASTFFFLYNVYRTARFGERVTADDPWGYSNSLEWATSCPPPRHNFTKMPRIRSERPAFDLHYPHVKQGRASLGLKQTVAAGVLGSPSSTDISTGGNS